MWPFNNNKLRQLQKDVAILQQDNELLRKDNAKLTRQLISLQTPKPRLLQDEPCKGASKLSKTLATKPDAKRVVRETYVSPPPAPPAPAPSSSNDFLMGALTGYVVNEIFSSPAPSPAPADPPSYDSGGGGDFGGGGSSGSWE